MSGEGVVVADQMQLRDLVVGPQTPYCWVDEIPDWWGYDRLRTNDTERTATHGVRGGRDLLGAKTLTGQVLAQATSRDDLRGLVDGFMAAWAPSDEDLPLVAMFLDDKRRRYGRPRRAVPAPRLMTRFSRVSKFASLIVFQFDALDPHAYSDDEHSLSTTTPVGGGFLVPFTVPFTVGASDTGIIAAYNAGNMNGQWTARIDGPITNPVISHPDQGRSLMFDANGGLALGSNDYVLIDSTRRSVLFNGSADRRYTLNLLSEWFDLEPGSNGIHFDADAGSGTLTLYWRDTYL